MKILSFGAGVQSTTLLLMMANGDLPKVDHCIFADVGWEPLDVYAHMRVMEQVALKAGMGFHVAKVTGFGLREAVMRGLDGIDKYRGPMLPFHVLNEDGTRSLMQRQCTRDYKITPVEKKIKELMGVTSFAKVAPKGVELHFGISGDEIQRMKTPRRKQLDYHYPLVMVGSSQASPLVWRRPTVRREDCLKYNEKHGYPAPRSACIGCPFHNDFEWSRIKQDAEKWDDAVRFDKAIRNLKGVNGKLFLHGSCVPLDEIDFDNEKNKFSLVDECGGYCGV